MKNVLEAIDRLKKAGVGFGSLTEGPNTAGPVGDAIFSVLAAFNQLERHVTVECTKAGLSSARVKGRVDGRPRVIDDKKINTARAL